jgi:hypothetical protein
MFALIVNILVTTLLFAVFKLFPRFGVRSKEAIVINYMFAAAFAWWAAGPADSIEKLGSPYTLAAAVVGLAFFYIFNKMSQCTVAHGVGVASIAAKLSMVIPVLIFMLLDDTDQPTALKIGAVLLAIPAVVLASAPPKSSKFGWGDLRLPGIVFLGSGMIDLGFGWFSGPEFMANDGDRYLFVAIPFTIALVIGFGQTAFQKRLPQLLHIPTVIGGAILGIVNVGTLYWLLQAFATVPLDRSAVMPLNNLGIVIASALMGALIFSERTTWKNIAGLGLGAVSIGFLLWPLIG